jgi:hypothetical protein
MPPNVVVNSSALTKSKKKPRLPAGVMPDDGAEFDTKVSRAPAASLPDARKPLTTVSSTSAPGFSGHAGQDNGGTGPGSAATVPKPPAATPVKPPPDPVLSQQRPTQSSALRPKLEADAAKLTFDGKTETDARLSEIDRVANLNRQALARRFNQDAGGAQSGASQTQFELFESNVLGEKNRTIADIAARAPQENRANVQLLASIVGQDEARALSEVNAALERAIAQGQATGQFIDPTSGEDVQTLDAKALAFTQSIQEAALTGQYNGTQTQQAQLQQLQSDIARAEQTGDFQGAQTLQAQRDALQAEIQRAGVEIQKAAQTQDQFRFLTQQTGQVGGGGPTSAAQLGLDISQAFNPDGTPNNQAQFELIDQLEAMGITMNQDQFEDFVNGGQVQLNTAPTLAAQDQAFRQQLAKEQQLLTETNDAMQRALAQGQATGQFIDPVTGKPMQTLQAEIDRANISLARTQVATQAAQWFTEQTGVVGGTSALKASDLGLDLTGLTNADGTPNNARYQELVDQVGSFGFGLDAQQFNDLLAGKSVDVAMTPTIAAKQLGIQQGDLKIRQDQQALVEVNAKLQRAIDQGNATGQFIDPVTGDTQDTIQQEQLNLQAEIQRGGLQIDQERVDLARLQEQHRASEAQAQITGKFTQNIGADTIGLDLSAVNNPDGTANLAALNAISDQITASFQNAVGRDPTPEEMAAIVNGQQVPLPATETLAKALQDNQIAINNARLTGDLNGAATLEQQQLDLQEELQNAQLALQESELFGGTQGISADTLGIADQVDALFDAQGNFTGTVNGFNAIVSSIESEFERLMGRKATGGEVQDILDGKSVGARDTLAQQQLDQQGAQFGQEQDLRRELATGLINIGGQFTESLDRLGFDETARQFDESLLAEVEAAAAAAGLDQQQVELAMAELNHKILSDTRALSADIAQNWANITGTTGFGDEPMSAQDFGVDLSGFDPGLDDASLAQTQEASLLADSYEAMTGRRPTQAEVVDILRGNTITVQGAPTRQSREFAMNITQQNMDRMNQYAAIAQEHGLDRDMFEQAKSQADKEWARITLDVGTQVGLTAPDQWQVRKHIMDSQVADAIANGEDPANIIATAALDYEEATGDSQANFYRANALFDQQFGFAAQQIADQRGMDADTFKRASEQADRHEDKLERVWASILGSQATGSVEVDFNNTADPQLKADFARLSQGALGPQEEAALRSRFEQNFGVVVSDSDWDGIQSRVNAHQSGAPMTSGELLSATQLSNLKSLLIQYPDSVPNSIEGLKEDYGIVISEADYPAFLDGKIEVSIDPNEPLNFTLPPTDWLTQMDSASMQSVFALINGGNISPERQSAASSWQMLGQSVGSILTSAASGGLSNIFSGG